MNPDDEDSLIRPVMVWDLPTRIFHLLLIATLAIGWATAEGEGVWSTVHRWNGYALVAALVFRTVWGCAGSRHSRFADFLRPWPEVRAHARALLELRPRAYVGHTPLGGWMILATLVTFALIAATGAFAAGEHGGPGGPFAAALPRWVARASGQAHETLFGVLIALVALHVVGALIEMLLTGENLIRVMITGRKWIAVEDARREVPPVGAGWALAVVAVSGVIVWFAFA